MAEQDLTVVEISSDSSTDNSSPLPSRDWPNIGSSSVPSHDESGHILQALPVSVRFPDRPGIGDGYGIVRPIRSWEELTVVSRIYDMMRRTRSSVDVNVDRNRHLLTSRAEVMRRRHLLAGWTRRRMPG